MKHLLECGVIVIHILGEPLLGELWVGQGLCEGLDISLHEVVVLGLITCGEVGVVKGVHLLSGEVRSVTTALKVVEEVQEEVQEIKDEWEEEEVEGHGGLKVEETRSSWDDHEMTRTNETWATMWCAIMTTRTWLLDCAHMGSRVHQFTCQCSCALCGRCSGSWWSRCHWCRESSPRIRNTKCTVLSFWMLQSTFALVVRLYSVIVNFICGQIVAHFCIAKTCHLRCCLYTSRRLQQTAVSCKRSIYNKINWIRESHFRRFSPKILLSNGSPRSLKTWLTSFLTFWIVRRPTGSLSLNTLLASLHAASRAPCSFHFISSWDRSSNFGALGLRWWGSPGQINPSEGFWSRILVWRATAFVNLTRWIGFYMSEIFRKIDFGGFMSWKTQPKCRAFDDLRPTGPRFNSW